MEPALQDLASTNLSLKFNLRRARQKVEDFLGMNREIKQAFARKEKEGLSDIPVFIISFDRLSCLKVLIEGLERVGLTNIHIIDNASTYPPLLEYYTEIPYDVIYMKQNFGSRVFWKSEIFDKYRNDFYIVTDSDLELLPECPGDLAGFLFNLLKKFSFVRKAGVSLKIDDIPEDSILGADVKQWESQFFKAPIKGEGAYYASVDTTLAMYLPDNLAKGIPFLRAIRSAHPYQARHLPWYKTKETLTSEDEYYSVSRSNGWWGIAEGKITPD